MILRSEKEKEYNKNDVLNVILIVNKAFAEACYYIFNPRNAMYISHDNGLFNMDLCIQRDSVINANTFFNLGRENYSAKQLAHIKKLKERADEFYGGQ